MNCIIAQSGGPTAVINASVAGLVETNNKIKAFDNVYAGLNGIQGILNKNIINLTNISHDDLNTFRYTPSSGLGSCRYKLKDYKIDDSEYVQLLDILDSLDVKAFFYVGGNDSMDTISKLGALAEEKEIDIKFIGIPKTIDNDLMYTDHTPGFGSAAKFIATSTLETYLDSTVYMDNGVFILETMGRDTGWLTAASCLAVIDGKQAPDLIYLPETAFDEKSFIEDVSRIYKEKKHVYIVASEGLKNSEDTFLSAINTKGSHDNFGHTQLGGVGNYLKNLIIENNITTRVKVLELGVLQRCSMHLSSKVDVEEAYTVGCDALKYSLEGHSGKMVAIKRDSSNPYASSTFLVPAKNVANKVKYFPNKWINERGNNVTDEAIEYLKPLTFGTAEYNSNNYTPVYKVFNN